MKLSDPNHVAEQYVDSSRFDARVRIYELYDKSPEPWLSWLFARLALRAGERVLEVGCGTGNLWRENAARLPALARLVLADLSPGMLAQARERLSGVACEFQLADAQALGLADAGFDLVLSNHVLYHVPDRARALAEMRRVLRPGGRVVVGTNHFSHLLELRELLTQFGFDGWMLSPLRDPAAFDLDTAAEELAAVFGEVEVERRESALEIRETGPLLDYIRSMAAGASADGAPLEPLRRHVEAQIARAGSFRVGIAAGMVRATRR